MAGITIKQLSVIMDSGIREPSNEQKQPDFVAMDGGRFFIGANRKDDLIMGLAQMLTNNVFNCALVPVAPDDCIFFADIDFFDETTHRLDVFLTKVAGFFNHFVTKKPEDAAKCTADDIIVFERANSRIKKYHIYIPEAFGITTKSERKTIWQAINIAMADDIIDVTASTIRFEGFNKWNKTAKMFVPDSHYVPRGKAKNMLLEDLFNAIWLAPRGWKTQLVPTYTPERPLRVRVEETEQKLEEETEDSSQISSIASAVSRSSSSVLPTDNNRNRDLSPEAGSHKSITPHIKRTIQLKFPEIANLFLTYPIVKIKNNAKENVLIKNYS